MLLEPTFGLYIARDSVNLVLIGKSFRGHKLMANVWKPVEQDAPFTHKVKSGFVLLDEFLTDRRINGWSLYLGFESDFAVLRSLDLPISVKENLRESIGYELENYVPFSVDNAFFDCQVIEEDKASGKLSILLVVTKKEIIEHIVSVASEFGYEIDGIEIGITAFTNAVLSKDFNKKSLPCFLVFLEDSWIEIAILDNGHVIYGSVIEISRVNGEITKQITEHLKNISESLGLRQKGSLALLCGPGVTKELLENLESTDLDIVVAEDIPNELQFHGLLFAYGVAIRAFSDVPMQINLLPKHLRRKPSKLSQYVMVSLCIMLLISMLGLWTGGIIKQRKMLKILDERIVELQSQVRNIEDKKKKCQELANQLTTLRQFINSPATPLDILAELTARIPKEAWLYELYISDKKVQISGFADVATDLIPALENSSLFHNVTFTSPVSKTRDGKERFRIELEIE